MKSRHNARLRGHREAIEIIQRLIDWFNRKLDVAERRGYDNSVRRYFQRIVALEDAQTAISQFGKGLTVMTDDTTLGVLVAATGHTEDDAALILDQLLAAGYAITPLPASAAASEAEDELWNTLTTIYEQEGADIAVAAELKAEAIAQLERMEDDTYRLFVARGLRDVCLSEQALADGGSASDAFAFFLWLQSFW